MYKVLIVDDETIVKIALRSIIDWEKQGFCICGAAANGMEALELIKTLKPHLVITDIKMPVLDGIELIRRINEQKLAVEVVVLSNYDDFECVRSALLLGASDYLLKIKLEEEAVQAILEKIKAKLDQQQETGEADREWAEQSLPIGSLDADKSLSVCLVAVTGQKFNPAVIRDTLLNSLQSQPGYKLQSLTPAEYLIIHQDQQVPGSREAFVQTLIKLSKQFAFFTTVRIAFYYAYQAADLAAAQEMLERGRQLRQFEFYENIPLQDIALFQPLHYLNFTDYKTFAKTLYRNKDKSPEINAGMITELVDEAQKRCLYPEILKLFFIKVLDYLLYLVKDVPMEVHDYVSDLKDDIRISEDRTALIEFLTRALAVTFNPQIMEEQNSANHYKPEVDRALGFIQENYTGKISLDTISREVNLSAGYLCRSFKAQVGMTITNYINQLRLEHARELLQKKEYSVKEAAYQAGFEDPLYFSRIFKKHYQVTPSEFLKSV